MDITKDRTELINEAASKLQIIGSGQSVEADDSDVIDAKIDPLLLQLSADGIVEVPDDEAIPSEYFDSIATLLANNSATDFGLAYDPGVKELHERLLRRLVSSRPTYEPQRADYF